MTTEQDVLDFLNDDTSIEDSIDHFVDSANFSSFEPHHKFQWTQKTTGFIELLWFQQFKVPELQTEVNALAFRAMKYIANTALRPPADSVYHKEMKCEEDVKEREIAFCEDLWSYTVGLACQIPATPDETAKLIDLVNRCTRKCFKGLVTPSEIHVEPPQTAGENMGEKVTIEEMEQLNMTTLPSGKVIPFGGRQWNDLKMFIRDTDGLWNDESDEEAWEELVGRSEIHLVRDGYLICSILTRLS